MENNNELQERYKRVKQHLIDRWADMNIKDTPTPKDIWGQMRAVAVQNREDALADDMQGYIEVYDKRISLIDAKLKAIADAEVNEQAEMNKAVNRYEQGMGTD